MLRHNFFFLKMQYLEYLLSNNKERMWFLFFFFLIYIYAKGMGAPTLWVTCFCSYLMSYRPYNLGHLELSRGDKGP